MNKKIIIQTYKELLKSGNRLDLLSKACLDEYTRYVRNVTIKEYKNVVITNSLTLLLTLCSVGIKSNLPYTYMKYDSSNIVQFPAQLLLDLNFVYKYETDRGTYVGLHQNGIDFINGLLSVIV